MLPFELTDVGGGFIRSQVKSQTIRDAHILTLRSFTLGRFASDGNSQALALPSGSVYFLQ